MERGPLAPLRRLPYPMLLQGERAEARCCSTPSSRDAQRALRLAELLGGGGRAGRRAVAGGHRQASLRLAGRPGGRRAHRGAGASGARAVLELPAAGGGAGAAAGLRSAHPHEDRPRHRGAARRQGSDARPTGGSCWRVCRLRVGSRRSVRWPIGSGAASGRGRRTCSPALSHCAAGCEGHVGAARSSRVPDTSLRIPRYDAASSRSLSRCQTPRYDAASSRSPSRCQTPRYGYLVTTPPPRGLRRGARHLVTTPPRRGLRRGARHLVTTPPRRGLRRGARRLVTDTSLRRRLVAVSVEVPDTSLRTPRYDAASSRSPSRCQTPRYDGASSRSPSRCQTPRYGHLVTDTSLRRRLVYLFLACPSI